MFEDVITQADEQGKLQEGLTPNPQTPEVSPAQKAAKNGKISTTK